MKQIWIKYKKKFHICKKNYWENNDKYFDVLNDIKKTLITARNLRYAQKFAIEFNFCNMMLQNYLGLL